MLTMCQIAGWLYRWWHLKARIAALRRWEGWQISLEEGWVIFPLNTLLLEQSYDGGKSYSFEVIGLNFGDCRLCRQQVVQTAFALKKLISSSVEKATAWVKRQLCANILNAANQISFSSLHSIHEVFLTSLIAATVILIASLHRPKNSQGVNNDETRLVKTDMVSESAPDGHIIFLFLSGGVHV